MPFMRRASAASLALAACFMPVPAFAIDDIVKPAPSPQAKIGPTVAAANAFCGEAPGKADELITRYSTDAKLQEVYKSTDYVAYGDDKANPTVMYTFTTKGHPAHPAAVCRRVVKEGEILSVQMLVVCDGEGDACKKLENDFNVLTAKMQAEVDQKIAAEKK